MCMKRHEKSWSTRNEFTDLTVSCAPPPNAANTKRNAWNHKHTQCKQNIAACRIQVDLLVSALRIYTRHATLPAQQDEDKDNDEDEGEEEDDHWQGMLTIECLKI